MISSPDGTVDSSRQSTRRRRRRAETRAPPVSSLGWIALAAPCGVLGALMSLAGPVSLLAVPVLAMAAVALRRPHRMPLVVVVGCAVYLGIYLRYRAQLGGFPLSALDLMGPLLLLAASALPRRNGAQTRREMLPVVLLFSGLLLGTIVGVANGAAAYDLFRIGSIDLALLVAATAGLIAGTSTGWQRSTTTAFLVAGVLAAGQQIMSFAYLATFGHSLWESLPFGADVASLNQAFANSAVAGTRDNFIPTFIMLPALALAVYRFRTTDVFTAAVLVLAATVSLSRVMWLASILVILLAVLARGRTRGGQRGNTILKIGVALTCVMAALVLVGSDLITARLSEVSDRNDPSLRFRQLETKSAAQALFSSPLSVLVGTGAGVVLVPSADIVYQDSLRGRTYRAPTSAVENQFLGRWRNFGLISMIGTAALLLGGGYASYRALVRRRSSADRELMALGLSLPVVFAVSPAAGTLLQVNVSLPFWLLAGTILAAAHHARIAEALAERDSHASRWPAPGRPLSIDCE